MPGDARDVAAGEPERLYPSPEASPPPPPLPGLDLEGIQRRLKAARTGTLGHPNPWREEYAKDVAALLAALRRERKRR